MARILPFPAGATHDKDVMVFMSGMKTGVAQPRTFKLCPLGCQFYSEKKLQEFDVLEFAIDIPTPGGRRVRRQKCTGAVVRCERERNMYRVWLHFLDLPRSARERIRCLAQKGDHLCAYCANY